MRTLRERILDKLAHLLLYFRWGSRLSVYFNIKSNQIRRRREDKNMSEEGRKILCLKKIVEAAKVLEELTTAPIKKGTKHMTGQFRRVNNEEK